LCFGLLVCALLACALSLAGCGYWEGTKDASVQVYKGYINPDPSVDLKRKGLTSKSDRKLAALFTPVDRQIDEVLIILGNQDEFPPQTWLDTFMTRFPWMGGVSVAALDGSVLAQQPEVALKTLDFQILAKLADDLRARKTRAFLLSTELGPELCVATPFFKSNVLAGAIVAHFDPRTLAAYSPKPEDLYMLSPQGPLWTDGEAPDQELIATGWTKLLKSSIRGTVKTGRDTYVWIARFIGTDPIIYATKADEDKKGFWPW
jgi:hypothetical protein